MKNAAKKLASRLAGFVTVALLVLGGCGGSSSPTTPVRRSLTYAALGASDAVGIGAFPPSEGYVYLLARRMQDLPATDVRLENFGINGALADEIVTSELEPAIAANPAAVTVWTGSNDVIRGRTPEAFGASLERILGELKTRTRAAIFVADLADLTRAPLFRAQPDPDVTAARIAAFNQRIVAAAAASGAVVVRLSAMPLDDSIFSIDGFHPSNKGHAQIADMFWAEMGPRLR